MASLSLDEISLAPRLVGVLVPVPPSAQQKLDNQAHESQPAAGAIEQHRLLFGQGHDIYISKLLNQAQTRIAHEERSGETGQGHGPDAEQKQAHNTPDQHA